MGGSVQAKSQKCPALGNRTPHGHREGGRREGARLGFGPGRNLGRKIEREIYEMVITVFDEILTHGILRKIHFPHYSVTEWVLVEE